MHIGAASKAYYLVPGAAVADDRKWGGLKPQKCIPSQSWGLEVQNPDVSRTTSPLKGPGEEPSSPLPVSGGPTILGILGL